MLPREERLLNRSSSELPYALLLDGDSVSSLRDETGLESVLTVLPLEVVGLNDFGSEFSMESHVSERDDLCFRRIPCGITEKKKKISKPDKVEYQAD